MKNIHDTSTPFSDIAFFMETEEQGVMTQPELSHFYQDESSSPFQHTNENSAVIPGSPYAEHYVSLLAELNDTAFQESLYELASEMEDSWSNKLSDELAMGNQFRPFVQREARAYYEPLVNEVNRIIDVTANHFSGSNLADRQEAEVEFFFETLEVDNSFLSPVQEQFLGSLIKKVKGVVKKGVDLAKKGIKAVGKLLPVNVLLNKLKGLVKPLLEKVLKTLINKLPENLRPHAQNLAKKFLNINEASDDIRGLGTFEVLETELDNNIAQLMFTSDEYVADDQVMEYENSFENATRLDELESAGHDVQRIDSARQNFINELKSLQPDQDPTPVIERFLPAAIIALQPIIKMAISVIGRDKIINFLAGIISGLIKKYVPENISKPLATKIIDIGMSAIGFEVYESAGATVAYEAIANTIEETIEGLNTMEPEQVKDPEQLTLQLFESFEKAAANNFPTSYLKPELRNTKENATWVGMPRNTPVKTYKKFTKIYDVTLDGKMASAIKIFRSIPLANFLKDKYGIDPGNPVKAKVHLFEMGRNGKLSSISKSSNLPGLNARVNRAWIQLLPLTTENAALLLNEPKLGTAFDKNALASRYKAKAGQRFFFLEMDGAKLRIPQTESKGQRTVKPNPKTQESKSADVQAVINFPQSEIKLNYFFSEEDAIALLEKANKNDYLGVASKIKNAVNTVFKDILKNHLSSKVKIIHEAIPELYLEAEEDLQDQFINLGSIGKDVGNAVIGKLIRQLTDLLSSKSYNAVLNFFKSRAKEFANAQAQPQDGVTLTLKWSKIQGLSVVKSAISLIKGNGSLPSLSDLSLPKLDTPEIILSAGKNFG